MMKLLFKYTAFMVVLLVLGAFDLYNAPFCSRWWLTALGVAGALCAFFGAWKCYRLARKIAEDIDDILLSMRSQLSTHSMLFKIILNGKESESKGEAEKQWENKAETSCDAESEDEFAHPI